MDAEATTLLEFFKQTQTNQFVIPIYQRLYSWKKEQCEQLWDDIIKIGGNDKMNGHFIGSILYVLDGNTPSSPLLIIDGQQRLTTITLLFIALRNRSSDEVKRKKWRVILSTAVMTAIRNSDSSYQSLIKTPCCF
ncbi:hypothetical protein VN1161_07910 [Helicobacter pylori]|nr:hypothetical protein VN0754_07650 [Helicobacter pylori]GHS40347.1 hypothetical protein VN1161_07910 [Helicobacter pylori]